MKSDLEYKKEIIRLRKILDQFHIDITYMNEQIINLNKDK